jgi:hypothetical protein
MVISREFEFKRFTELEREIQAQSINFITRRVDNLCQNNGRDRFFHVSRRRRSVGKKLIYASAKKRASCKTDKSSANLEVVARPKYFSAIRSDVYQLKFSTRVQNVFISQSRAQLSSLYDMWQSERTTNSFVGRSRLTHASLECASERANGQIIQHHERDIISRCCHIGVHRKGIYYVIG